MGNFSVIHGGSEPDSEMRLDDNYTVLVGLKFPQLIKTVIYNCLLDLFLLPPAPRENIKAQFFHRI